MRKLLAVACAIAITATWAPGGAASLAPPDVQGPKIPPVTAPHAIVTAFEREVFFCTEGARHTTISVPDVDSDRIILELTILPVREPWDRLFGVAIAGVEVLRGTTPRTYMTLRKDVTEFASLMPPGEDVVVSLMSGSYVGYLEHTVKLEFYVDEPTGALVRTPARSVVPSIAWRALTGDGTRVAAAASFPLTAPASAVVELTITGHGQAGEFWYLWQRDPPTFRILVDGNEVAFARAMPYVYALAGFGASVVCDPEGGSNNSRLHQVMWWTAQRAADAAGVHTGAGEIPPYRVPLDVADLHLLTGARTIEVVQEVGDGPQRWPASVSFLLG